MVAECRYEGQNSFYHQVTGYFKQLLNSFTALGPSAEEAAKDIVKGLAELQLPRFIYVGHSIWPTLRRGFVQQWLFNGWIARQILRETGLDKLAQYLPGVPRVPLQLRKEQ